MAVTITILVSVVLRYVGISHLLNRVNVIQKFGIESLMSQSYQIVVELCFPKFGYVTDGSTITRKSV